MLKEQVKYASHAQGDKIQSDIEGLENPQSYNGGLYYVSLTDDYTR